MTIDTTVLRTPDCPHADSTIDLVREVADDLGLALDIEIAVVDSPDEAASASMFGSPTVRIAGRDLEDPLLLDDRDPALACRLYEDGGTPARWMVESGLLRETSIDHLLFLCVANSARSQIAEGLARRIAADREVRISSAGSDPSQIRDGAVRVLEQIDIDPADQHSKGLEAVETDSVDTVITLCAEEACPAYLGDARRLHWPLPDPAGTDRGDDDLDAFRDVRDELERRLRHLLG